MQIHSGKFLSNKLCYCETSDYRYSDNSSTVWRAFSLQMVVSAFFFVFFAEISLCSSEIRCK